MDTYILMLSQRLFRKSIVYLPAWINQIIKLFGACIVSFLGTFLFYFFLLFCSLESCFSCCTNVVLSSEYSATIRLYNFAWAIANAQSSEAFVIPQLPDHVCNRFTSWFHVRSFQQPLKIITMFQRWCYLNLLRTFTMICLTKTNFKVPCQCLKFSFASSLLYWYRFPGVLMWLLLYPIRLHINVMLQSLTLSIYVLVCFCCSVTWWIYSS